MSSSCIGWAILELDEESNQVKFIKCDYYQPPKKETGNFLERLNITKKAIKKIIKEAAPNYIAIEDIIQFMPQKSKAQTIITLAVFNRMIGLIAYEYLRKCPNLYAVMTIRHTIKINKELPQKEDIPDLTAKHLGITFPYVYGKKNKKIDKKSYDMGDAVAVALCHALKIINK